MKLEWTEWNGKEIKKMLEGAGQKALFEGGQFILQESNKRVPHDEGTLQASGETSQNASRGEVVVSYDTPYALRWHEEPANFQKGRQHKYLESTLNDKSNDLLNHIAQGIKKEWR